MTTMHGCHARRRTVAWFVAAAFCVASLLAIMHYRLLAHGRVTPASSIPPLAVGSAFVGILGSRAVGVRLTILAALLLTLAWILGGMAALGRKWPGRLVTEGDVVVSVMGGALFCIVIALLGRFVVGMICARRAKQVS